MVEKCTACSGTLKAEGRVKRCRKCGGLHIDHIYMGDVYAHVKLGTLVDPPDGADLRYFDITYVGSDGLHRAHGWYDPQTLLVAQYG